VPGLKAARGGGGAAGSAQARASLESYAARHRVLGKGAGERWAGPAAVQSAQAPQPSVVLLPSYSQWFKFRRIHALVRRRAPSGPRPLPVGPCGASDAILEASHEAARATPDARARAVPQERKALPEWFSGTAASRTPKVPRFPLPALPALHLPRCLVLFSEGIFLFVIQRVRLSGVRRGARPPREPLPRQPNTVSDSHRGAPPPRDRRHGGASRLAPIAPHTHTNPEP
jgi:hypothetical protein